MEPEQGRDRSVWRLTSSFVLSLWALQTLEVPGMKVKEPQRMASRNTKNTANQVLR